MYTFFLNLWDAGLSSLRKQSFSCLLSQIFVVVMVATWKTATLYRVSIRVPSIAQLVERRTVEV